MSSIRRTYFRADILAPATPGGLFATAVAQGRIDLQCNPVADTVGTDPRAVVSGVRGYRWHYALSNVAPLQFLAETVVPTYRHTGLPASTVYWYSVSAIDHAGNESGKPSRASAQTLPPVVNPPPVLGFSAVPQTVNIGASSRLTWATTNATSLTASGAWTGPKALQGSQFVTPAARSTYTLTAAGPGGNTTRSVTVDIAEGSGGTGPSDGLFAFAEIPEIAFVQGKRDFEPMGLYMLDPRNRPEPGDKFWLNRFAESTLASIAATIEPYTFVELPCPDLATRLDDYPDPDNGWPDGRPLFDVTQDTGTGTFPCAINWGNRVEWDAVRQEIIWVGSNHDQDGQPHNSKWYRYRTLTNEWSADADPHNKGAPTSGIGNTGSWKTGHTYNESAFDSLRRILWKYDAGTTEIRGINVDDGTYWGNIACPTNANTGNKGLVGFGRALIYNPVLDALIFGGPMSQQNDGNGHIYIRRTVGDTPYYLRSGVGQIWEELKDANNVGAHEIRSWHMVGYYHPAVGHTIVGGGAGNTAIPMGQSRAFYLVRNDLTMVRLPDAPYSISVSEPTAETNDPKRAQFCPDPRSHKGVVFSGEGYVYEFDHDTLEWGTTPRTTLPFINKNVVVCPIYELGVIVLVKWGLANTARMFVYRHT